MSVDLPTMAPDTVVLEPITISTDQAVTLGLLVTELMINSNKHAYGGKPAQSKSG